VGFVVDKTLFLWVLRFSPVIIPPELHAHLIHVTDAAWSS
jgi:hypothetical protein